MVVKSFKATIVNTLQQSEVTFIKGAYAYEAWRAIIDNYLMDGIRSITVEEVEPRHFILGRVSDTDTLQVLTLPDELPKYTEIIKVVEEF